MRLLQAVACVGLLAVGATPVFAENYAIIIGVNDCPRFRLPDGSKPRPLRGAEADADALASVLLRDYGFGRDKVFLLKGSEATYARIKAAFQEVAARAGPDDVFVFHFSGHGTQIPDRPPYDEPDGLDECLCPYDATHREENLIVDDELGVWLEKVRARWITVILDCCHADTGTKDSDEDLGARYLPIQIEK